MTDVTSTHALAVIDAIVTDTIGIWAIAASHVAEEMAVGDISFVVTVEDDHRRAAFGACEQIVEQVEAPLPIWKHHLFDDRTHERIAFA